MLNSQITSKEISKILLQEYHFYWGKEDGIFDFKRALTTEDNREKLEEIARTLVKDSWDSFPSVADLAIRYSTSAYSMEELDNKIAEYIKDHKEESASFVLPLSRVPSLLREHMELMTSMFSRDSGEDSFDEYLIDSDAISDKNNSHSVKSGNQPSIDSKYATFLEFISEFDSEKFNDNINYLHEMFMPIVSVPFVISNEHIAYAIRLAQYEALVTADEI